MSRYWSKKTTQLEPYVPGEQPKVADLIKLNTNENPYGPSPMVIKALTGDLGDGLRLYPDPNSDLLKRAIADYYGVDISCVFVGNGSDEVLAHTFQALLQQSLPILCPDISYSFYPVYCNLYGVECISVPLNDAFEICADDYLQENGGIIFANPNAPTGRLLELEKIEWLLERNRDSVVVVDEAYIDFGGKTAVPLVEKYDNLLVVQTLSKSRSLAGLRIGFAVGSEELVDGLERVKNSFNSYPMDRLAIVGGAAAMADREYFEKTRQSIIESRKWLSDELEKRDFDVLPSSANFVFARKEGWGGGDLCKALRQKNVLVRHFEKPRISQFVRITVGTDKECRALVEALDQIIGQ